MCGPVLSSNIQTEACLDLTGTGTIPGVYISASSVANANLLPQLLPTVGHTQVLR